MRKQLFGSQVSTAEDTLFLSVVCSQHCCCRLLTHCHHSRKTLPIDTPSILLKCLAEPLRCLQHLNFINLSLQQCSLTSTCSKLVIICCLVLFGACWSVRCVLACLGVVLFVPIIFSSQLFVTYYKLLVIALIY